jgi:hypothetical protein
MMAVAKSPSGNLEERLALISQMLEEAVCLLRNTMTEVKAQEDEGRSYDDPDCPPRYRRAGEFG